MFRRISYILCCDLSLQPAQSQKLIILTLIIKILLDITYKVCSWNVSASHSLRSLITHPVPLRHIFYLRNMSNVSEGGAWTGRDSDSDSDRPCAGRTPGTAEISRRSSGSVEEARRCARQPFRIEITHVKYFVSPLGLLIDLEDSAVCVGHFIDWIDRTLVP